MGQAPRFRMRFSGDTLLLVELGDRIDADVNADVMRVASLVSGRQIPGVRDVVPAYCSVGIHFDPLYTDLPALERAVTQSITARRTASATDRSLVRIPVCYGGAHGPDLDELARWARLTPEEVVQRHVSRTYRVYMLGFVPGFAYMAHVDPAIAIPRHRVPRERVPIGSVAIAGEQTGVYPAATPGGWHLIGRSPAKMYDHAQSPPSRCAPGDAVQFVRVSEAEYSDLALTPGGIGGAW
jgi:KipI family sensor histidine kinase inhibitor